MAAVPLLLAFDGSPASLRAAEFVAGYRGDAARLAPIVVNVQSRPVTLWPGFGLDPLAVDEALLAEGRSALAPALERLSQAALAPQPAVRLGLPAQALLAEARARGATAIVMGTRGGGAMHGFAFGSVAMRVAHGGAAPTIIVGPDARLPAALGERLRVLLATDGSGPALRAAERLVAWRDWLGELDVQLVYVQQPLSVARTVLPPHDDVIREWSSAEGEKAAQAARELLASAGVRHHLHLTFGDPARELGKLAEQTAAELVVLGTRGLGAAHHALIGSVALKAAALSRVPAALVS